jgi:hypothetical protein
MPFAAPQGVPDIGTPVQYPQVTKRRRVRKGKKRGRSKKRGG